jgi:hypothetical protein
MSANVSQRMGLTSSNFVVNNTHGIVRDLIQAVGQQTGAIDITAIRAAQVLRATGGGNVVAHSQGTQVVRNGLSLLSTDIRSNITFQGFGGQTTIDANQFELKNASNSARRGDPVAALLNWGSESPYVIDEVGDRALNFRYHDFNEYLKYVSKE